MHYLLFYEVADDYVARRAEFRAAHLEKVWAACERGELVLAGALANPVDGAVLLFQGDSPGVAEKFAEVDPYVTGGAVKRWYVREWTTVAGEGAATPMRLNTPAGDKQRASEPSKAVRENSSSQLGGTIFRLWRGRSSPEKAGEYNRHVTSKVFPALRAIEGHRGAYLLRRTVEGAVEYLVITLWDSMQAVRRFAGAEPEKAVVEPEARAVLATYDETVTHFEVVHAARGPANKSLDSSANTTTAG